MLALLILIAAGPLAEDPKPASLSGEWIMEVESGSGPRQFALKLEQKGPQLSGEVSDPRGAVPLEQVSFSDGRLSFRVGYQGSMWDLKATLRGDTLEGDYSGNATGNWRARRPPDPTGSWQCRTTAGDTEDRTFTLSLKQTPSGLTGTAASPRGSAYISKGSRKGNTIELTVATEEGNYVLTGVVEQGRIRGQWRRWDDRTGAWEGERK